MAFSLREVIYRIFGKGEKRSPEFWDGYLSALKDSTQINHNEYEYFKRRLEANNRGDQNQTK